MEILNDNMRLSHTLVSEQPNTFVRFEYVQYNVLKLNYSLTIELCYGDTYLLSNEIQVCLAFEKFQTKLQRLGGLYHDRVDQ